MSDDEERVTKSVVDLATKYGACGYRRVTALLRADGWRVNHKRVAMTAAVVLSPV